MSATVTLPEHVVTRALRGIADRLPGALDDLWRLVYPWVVHRAKALLHGEPLRFDVGDAEDLAHEAFLRLKPAHLGACRDRHHLIRIATRAMRQALVDRARRERRRGRLSPLDDGETALDARPDVDDALDMALAIDALQAVNPRLAEVATLRAVGGLHFGEIGRVLAIGEANARRLWRKAAAWLGVRLEP